MIRLVFSYVCVSDLNWRVWFAEMCNHIHSFLLHCTLKLSTWLSYVKRIKISITFRKWLMTFSRVILMNGGNRAKVNLDWIHNKYKMNTSFEKRNRLSFTVKLIEHILIIFLFCCCFFGKWMVVNGSAPRIFCLPLFLATFPALSLRASSIYLSIDFVVSFDGRIGSITLKHRMNFSSESRIWQMYQFQLITWIGNRNK